MLKTNRKLLNPMQNIVHLMSRALSVANGKPVAVDSPGMTVSNLTATVDHQPEGV